MYESPHPNRQPISSPFSSTGMDGPHASQKGSECREMASNLIESVYENGDEIG